MAASRFLAASVCALLVSFAAENLEACWNWLHQGCASDLTADFLNFGAGDFLSSFSFKNLQNRSFALWRPDLVLELQFLPLYPLCGIKPFCEKACV